MPVPAPHPATSEQMACFRRALKVLEGKWKCEILWHLSYGVKRFGELRRSLPGITHQMLALRLRELEAVGLVQREVYDEVPPRVEYRLTQAPVELTPMFHALLTWAKNHDSMLSPATEGKGLTALAH